MKRFRGGLVFKAHRLFVSLNSRLESNKEEGETRQQTFLPPVAGLAGVANMLLMPTAGARPRVSSLLTPLKGILVGITLALTDLTDFERILCMHVYTVDGTFQGSWAKDLSAADRGLGRRAQHALDAHGVRRLLGQKRAEDFTWKHLSFINLVSIKITTRLL